MSDRSSKLLLDLVAYGNTGRHDALLRVGQAVEGGQKFGTVHMSLAAKVKKKILKLLKDPRIARIHVWAWRCLWSLSDPTCNTLADGLVGEMQKSNILELFACGYVSATLADQASRVLLYGFAEDNDNRCCQIWLQDGLLEALLQVVDSWHTGFGPQESSVVANTLQIFEGLFSCSHAPAQRLFLKGRGVFDSLLGKLVTVYKHWHERRYSES